MGGGRGRVPGRPGGPGRPGAGRDDEACAAAQPLHHPLVHGLHVLPQGGLAGRQVAALLAEVTPALVLLLYMEFQTGLLYSLVVTLVTGESHSFMY